MEPSVESFETSIEQFKTVYEELGEKLPTQPS
jgi:hypothetical protein